MSNVLSMDRQQQVVALGQLGWTLRRIQDATGVRRETVSRYLKGAGIPVREERRRHPPKPASQVTTGPPAGEASPAGADTSPASKAASEVTTDPSAIAPGYEPPAPKPRPASQTSKCEPFRELIEQGMRQGRNAMGIYQDLVDEHAFPHAYLSVRRFVRKLKATASPEACGIIITPPGQEAQVDYGDGPLVRHPQTGKYRRTRLFVLTLGYSRKSVRLLTWKSSSQEWAHLHERAFRRLGGAPQVVVLDNLKEGIITPDCYDPLLNPLYGDVMRHYGVALLPCRPGDPDRKGKVESGVGHAQATPLKGKRFESLEEAQAYLDRWEERWGDTRIHGTVKRQVAALFAEERPHLKPLPIEPFRYYEYGKRTVHPSGTVEVVKAYYSVPPGWIGRDVLAQWDERTVRVVDPATHQLLREHLRQVPGNYRIAPADRPRRTPASTERLLERACTAGPSVGMLCKQIHAAREQTGVRSILGILSLAAKHGPVATDAACSFALKARMPTYRMVKRYLDHQRPLPLNLTQIDPLIAELSRYRDLVSHRAAQAHAAPSGQGDSR